MSRNYKFHNPEGLYFVNFAVVDWLNVFTDHTKGFVRQHCGIKGVAKSSFKASDAFSRGGAGKVANLFVRLIQNLMTSTQKV
ncbi:hypothetical protein Lupro_01015 [Lutibacter profundi]|uniref:Uncharacterized protein n=1 Tax=Lutibacter profundi TaxID=1622118 RepID=A0A109RMW9_9FLAO|nr:hypothetical protein [Lutibacter profundi]AMC09922.1 hypothetical protein Lupro_01015 [Lutibacter profundi]